MKSTQLLSVVLSMILVFGVSAGSAFAQTDDIDDIDNSMENDNFDDSYTSGNDDDDRDDDRYENDDDDRDRDDMDDKHDDLEDRLEDFCEMSDEEKNAFFEDHPRMAQFKDRLTNYCDLSEDERDDAIEDFIEKHIPKARDYDDYDLDDVLDRYCEMTDEEKSKFASMHDNADDHIAKVNAYCELDDEDERDAYIDEHEDEFRMSHDKKMKEKLEQYCEMSDADKREYLAEHDKTTEHAEKMNRYCTLDDDGKMKFIDEHRDEYISHMKKKMMSEYKKEHMMSIDEMKAKHEQARNHKDYSRLCELTEGERLLKIDDPEKLERVSEWCQMTPEERDAIKKEHHDAAMDFKEKHHDSVEKMKEKIHKEDLSPRLKEMIMTSKHDVTDERMDEIKMKFKEKYGDMVDMKKSELKMKFKDHLSSIKIRMSDEHKSAIHDRVAEMKAFKAELREKASDMTLEEKQQLREEFIEKAKDMHLAWISPRIQMTAGVDAADVECREGFNLVMKASNGVPMCLKSDTALKMIEKGIAVPAN